MGQDKKRSAISAPSKLAEALEASQISQNEWERRLGLARGALSHLLHRRQAAGLFWALVLFYGLGIDVESWLTADQRARLDAAKAAGKERTKKGGAA